MMTNNSMRTLGCPPISVSSFFSACFNRSIALSVVLPAPL